MSGVLGTLPMSWTRTLEVVRPIMKEFVIGVVPKTWKVIDGTSKVVVAEV
jgi:hypothetical protein